MGGSPRALQFHLDTQIEDLSAQQVHSFVFAYLMCCLIQVGPLLKRRWRSTGRPVRVSIAVADIELAVQGSFSNRLESIENLDTADVASASLV